MRDLQDFHLGLIGLDLGHLDALQGVAQLETGKDVGQHILAAFHEGRLGMNHIENEIHAPFGHRVDVALDDAGQLLDRRRIQLDLAGAAGLTGSAFPAGSTVVDAPGSSVAVPGRSWPWETEKATKTHKRRKFFITRTLTNFNFLQFKNQSQ